MNSTIASYMAGLMDGEGYFNISRTIRKPSCGYVPRIGIANTDRRLIDWIVENFGGKVVIRRPGKFPAQWGTRVRYEWYLTGQHAISVCNLVIPYLVIKKERAEILIELQKLLSPGFRGKGRGIPKENLEKRESLYMLLRSLVGTKHKVVSSS